MKMTFVLFCVLIYDAQFFSTLLLQFIAASFGVRFTAIVFYGPYREWSELESLKSKKFETSPEMIEDPST